MNNHEILSQAFSCQLSREQLLKENMLRNKEEGLYSHDLGGIVNLYGVLGLFQIVHYCGQHKIMPVFIRDSILTEDGGEVIFKRAPKQ